MSELSQQPRLLFSQRIRASVLCRFQCEVDAQSQRINDRQQLLRCIRLSRGILAQRLERETRNERAVAHHRRLTLHHIWYSVRVLQDFDLIVMQDPRRARELLHALCERT